MGKKRRGGRSERRPSGEEPVEPTKPGCRTPNAGLVQRLGEAEYRENAGRVGFMNLVAASGAPVPEGVVLTHEFHRRFLDTGGVAGDIREASHAGGESRRRARELERGHKRAPLDGELNRMICDAIIGLGGRTVVVISEDATRSGLRTLPEARDAVRKAWLSAAGLERQIKAASRGEEIPTWPVLIQRETYRNHSQ